MPKNIECFTQHELGTNILIKEAVWRLSNGKSQLILPQSVEVKKFEAAYLRNVNLLDVMRADIMMTRFDGPELDSGTVVEFVMAKSLGKPTVILRCDYRHLSGTGIDEPYNLMARNWPRTVEVHIDSIVSYVGLLAEERQTLGDTVTFETTLKAELNTIQKGVDEIAQKIVDGLEAVIKLKSPYPPEYREVVYKALRYSPGSGFDQLFTENELDETIQRLKENGTL